jgi:hypothetical protein
LKTRSGLRKRRPPFYFRFHRIIFRTNITKRICESPNAISSSCKVSFNALICEAEGILFLTDLFIFSMSSIYQAAFRLVLAAADAYDARSNAKFKQPPPTCGSMAGLRDAKLK